MAPAAAHGKRLTAPRAGVRPGHILPGRQVVGPIPALARRLAAKGHTMSHHGWSHSMASKISFEKAKEDIDRGIAADEMALHGISTIAPSTPFLRFRNFDSTPKTLDLLQDRGIVVFGADLWASDWEERPQARS
ncbi:peptidoglycan/xylan/chitin deacetylase (PgdA/CDA1 family) [Bradyrhizobium sp. S3.2.6]|uniref:hypothetical protein n=1 Tax=Bradyrhizobium sp. S3.2.6 TaxID=3156428 RepID=UPI003397F552